MKVKSRKPLCGNFIDDKKPKKAIEWCMRFLCLDIDNMSSKEFIDLVTVYENIVAYPISIPYYFFSHAGMDLQDLPKISKLPTPSAEEIEVRNIFKVLQETAKKRFNELEQMKDAEHEGFTEINKLTFSLSVNRYREFLFDLGEIQDFEYSFLWHFGQFLQNKKFDDVIKTCSVCGKYFALLTKHPKLSCSHSCAMLLSNKRRIAEKPILWRRRGNLEAHYSVLKKKGYPDEKIKLFLRSYLNKREYSQDEIPRSIQKFLGKINDEFFI